MRNSCFRFNRPTLGLAIVSVLVAVAGEPARAQVPAQSQSASAARVREVNQGTIGLAAGQAEGAPLRFATELARVLDDGDRMRVLPVVTRGPFENVDDLLFLRGIDAAIIYGDVLDHLKANPRAGGIESRIHYLTHLFPSELHVFARPEIKSLADLAGKRVNFNTRGTAAAYSGPIVFERLGIKVDARFDPHPVAMGEMAKGDKFAATVWVSTKPLDPFLKRQWPDGFKFLPVPLSGRLADYYLPAQLDAVDYPGLVKPGESIQTISVPAVLAVYAWPEGSDRHARLARLVDYLFERLPRLQREAGYHPRWKDLNLAGSVPGWQRFGPMQRRLDALAGPMAAPATSEPIATPAAATSQPPAARAAAPLKPKAVATRPPARTGLQESEARAALRQAGFDNVGMLQRDQQSFWRGEALAGQDRLRVAVDHVGNVYFRKLGRR